MALTQVFGKQPTKCRLSVENIDTAVLMSTTKLGNVEKDCNVPLKNSHRKGNRIINYGITSFSFFSFFDHLWPVHDARVLR